MRKLRCFVAMAFGYPDTDATFDKIKRLIGDRVDVRRVDRINHNRDIDDKIVEELRSADFVLADLTYARPSVYWEAGYAQARPIPVIYTARRDHVGRRAVEDGLRVHFDLQMRNVILWGGSVVQFRQQLKARVALVTRPLIQDEKASERAAARRRGFAGLSRIKQLEALSDEAVKLLKAEGFQLVYWPREMPARIQLRRALAYAYKAVGGSLLVAHIEVLPSIRSAEVQGEFRSLLLRDLEVNLNVRRKPPKQIEVVGFLLSPTRVQERVLRDSLPTAEVLANTASLNPLRLQLPAAKLWASGAPVRQDWGASYSIGDRRFEAKDGATRIEAVHATSRSKRRVGGVAACVAIRRIRIVGGIREPAELANFTEGAFLCGEPGRKLPEPVASPFH